MKEVEMKEGRKMLSKILKERRNIYIYTYSLSCFHFYRTAGTYQPPPIDFSHLKAAAGVEVAPLHARTPAIAIAPLACRLPFFFSLYVVCAGSLYLYKYVEIVIYCIRSHIYIYVCVCVCLCIKTKQNQHHKMDIPSWYSIFQFFLHFFPSLPSLLLLTCVCVLICVCMCDCIPFLALSLSDTRSVVLRPHHCVYSGTAAPLVPVTSGSCAKDAR
jgi:hypothetical protein